MKNISINTDPSCGLQAEVIQDLWATWIFCSLISVNIVLYITATLGNALILVSLQVCYLLHHRSCCFVLWHRLILVLACFAAVFCHLRISLSGQTNCVIAKGAVHICSTILCGISLNTLTAISMDRLLALLLALTYRHTVTLVRFRGIIIIISWLVLAGFTQYVVLLVGTSFHDCCCYKHTTLYCGIIVLLYKNILHSTLSTRPGFAAVWTRSTQQISCWRAHVEI